MAKVECHKRHIKVNKNRISAELGQQAAPDHQRQQPNPAPTKLCYHDPCASQRVQNKSIKIKATGNNNSSQSIRHKKRGVQATQACNPDFYTTTSIKVEKYPE